LDISPLTRDGRKGQGRRKGREKEGGTVATFVPAQRGKVLKKEEIEEGKREQTAE